MVIKAILPATESEIEEANQIIATRPKPASRRGMPAGVRQVLDILDNADGATITFEGDDQRKQAVEISVKLRGHMTNPDFRHKDITLTIIDEETAPKLVVKRRIEG